MIVAFTGTRHGFGIDRIHRITEYLKELQPDEVRHGDCVGADQSFHVICSGVRIPKIHIHPPANPSLRANCDKRATPSGVEIVVHEEEHYLKRNKIMVDHSDLLIAAPFRQEEQQRGGTWFTVRYARKTGLSVVIFGPEKTVHEEADNDVSDP